MANVADGESDNPSGQGGPGEPRQMLAVVTGTIHPNRVGWTFDEPIRYTLNGARCQLSIVHSLFNLFIEADRPEDIPTFLNGVGSIVQGCLDALGFFLAAPLRAEVLSMIVDGVEIHYRKLQWDELLPDDSNIARVEGVTLEPFTRTAIEEPLIRLALADLRTALEQPGDTVMLCFRAIESIRQCFLDGDADDDSARKRSWIDLRTKLVIERDEITTLEALATSRRHGAETPTSEEQRIEALTLARRIVERFIAYRAPSIAASRESDL